jgi:hypothetical protein
MKPPFENLREPLSSSGCVGCSRVAEEQHQVTIPAKYWAQIYFRLVEERIVGRASNGCYSGRRFELERLTYSPSSFGLSALADSERAGGDSAATFR